MYTSSPSSGTKRSFFSQAHATFYCQEQHRLNDCHVYRALASREKLKFVRSKKLCENCYSTRHFSGECKVPNACGVTGCGFSRKHMEELHEASLISTRRERQSAVANENKGSAAFPSLPAGGSALGKPGGGHAGFTGSISCCANTESIKALPIVPVKVKGKGSREVALVYALLDSGSTSTWCTSNLLHQLGICGRDAKVLLSTIQGGNVGVDSTICGKPTLSRDDQRVVKKYDDSVRLVDGHYEIAIPWKPNAAHLPDPDNKLMAEHRLRLLIGVLTRFREEPFCLMSDIESMYYQVKVDSDDIDALRFLWYPNNDISQDPVEYRMLVHPFGGFWSASCANYALRRTAMDNAKDFDIDVIKIVERNVYVDDCLKSVESEDVAIKLSQDLTSLLARGGFRLTKWLSNSRKVIDSIPAQERAKEVKDLDLTRDELPIERALGVKWDMEKDKFVVQLKPKVKPATRRGFGSVVDAQLHHFADASETGDINCSFVIGKSRIAPLKKISIPRLELSAATLAVRLDQMISREVDVKVDRSIFWTDSTAVLGYINNNNKRYKTFVANRGPDFLWTAEQFWPTQIDTRGSISEDDPEIKVKSVFHSSIDQGATETLNKIFSQFSSWFKLKKVIAWLLRYKSWIMFRVKGKLKVDEMKQAEREIVACIQRQNFQAKMDVISTSKATGKISSVKSSSTIFKLSPIMRDGLLCVGGRLGNSQLSLSARHPVILPRNHPVVSLLIRHYHIVSGHSGQEHVLSLIREKFWIIRGRVRKVLRSCFDCRRRQNRPEQQVMSDLPSDRVTPDKPPFTFTAVDYFGPFLVKRGKDPTMDTSSFISALRRFISRRGMPQVMRSDNGGNFKAGEKEIRQCIEEWNNEQIDDFMLQRNICWKFNTPLASHMGGVWERCIRTVRKVLLALLKEQVMDDEGLSTLMCEVEAIVNSLPLTKVSEDPDDLEALTPYHLLQLRKGPNLSPGRFQAHDSYSIKRWKHVQYMADIFWRRWTKEYLPSLQQRTKWQKPERNLKTGDLVLLVDELSPRCSWTMGRVLETVQGKDNKVRQVKLKTSKNAIISRPIHKLCVLEEV
ncbi:hypothetical protein AC249_AIPGENE21546 [Exaiptasia diaphana]|nr:hypothetical protein AC249_AIPGENE21546 [Exaiptasia diaphana]